MTAPAATVRLPAYAQPLFYPKRYKVLWGGRGAARSWSISRALLLKASEERKRILCTREMQSSLRDSVHQLLRDQIDSLELPGFRVTDREIRHRGTGSLFLFEGLRYNITKIKSLEAIDICWVEEAERITKESWNVLIPTIRKEGSEIWVSFNPDQLEDATYQRFIVHPPKNAWVLKVGWEHNPWLTEVLREEKDYAYAVDAEAAEHVWGGALRTVSNAQILRGKWAVEEFTVPKDRLTGDPLWHGPYQGMDFGFADDPFAALRCWIHDTTLYVEHESWHLHCELDDIPATVTEDIPAFDDVATRADSARPDSISFLRRHGLPQTKPVKKRAGSVEDGILHLRAYTRIVIHPRCRHVADEAKRYSYKVDPRSGDVLPVILDAHNHLMDCLRYALEPMIKPRRLMGVLTAEVEPERPICPECESLLLDATTCAHCGWRKEIVPRAHANGNGNGHMPTRALRGINDA